MEKQLRTKSIPVVDGSKTGQQEFSEQKPVQSSSVSALSEQKIQIQPQQQQEKTFELHIPRAAAVQSQAPEAILPKNDQSTVAAQTLNKHDAFSEKKKNSSSKKIWGFLEWIATSALIFLIIFFIANFSSYFSLFKLKLDQLRGEVKKNPYTQNFFSSQQQKTAQELLPLSQTPEQNRKQVPDLNLEVAPPDERIILHSVNENVPIIQVSSESLIKKDWASLENNIQNALRDGVVHYPGTAQPGQHGNVVITGHSSYFNFDPGRFKDVFAALHYVKNGEQIVVFHNQKKYLYEIYDIKTVNPTQVEVLTQEGEDRLTLITCTPIGTNWKRKVVLARPIVS